MYTPTGTTADDGSPLLADMVRVSVQLPTDCPGVHGPSHWHTNVWPYHVLSVPILRPYHSVCAATPLRHILHLLLLPSRVYLSQT